MTVPAVPIAELVDATGAGDLYAAGFLFGLATGRDLETCGKLAPCRRPRSSLMSGRVHSARSKGLPARTA